ncbi:regulatory protein YycH of two-component signal transduction system YycFG [Scopulibacillus daqui]|uniref:Regulatory protein YycH of two-component signal transduction system YycFG n=1 Tax=Scopulibacillus daqui TaxID=1469162 RepID=A0ABS2PZW8_9BACL|nr:two-component system activity regulator YycH [Scopulibacillus daqui]MBM7645506.1 regulatory protein YycH of two-component signal transduction system YycFG [Scopulibacillus daqui]
MTRETGKTILLTLLVLLSVVLTWNIWFYQTSYKSSKGPSDSVKNIAIADSKSLKDVVKPSLAIFYRGNGMYGITKSDSVGKIYSLFRKAKFTNVYPIYGQHNIPQRGGNNGYEIVFPAPVTIAALQKLFNFDSEDLSVQNNLMIDRVEIFNSSTNNNQAMALFKTQKDKSAFYATVKDLNMNHLYSLFSNSNLVSYYKQQLKAKTVYLPAVKTKVRSILSFYDTVSFTDFVPILFNDPDNAVYSKGSYSDGSHQLEKSGNVLQYVNPAISDNSADIEDPIIHSYEFVNGHKGWTDDYIYDGITGNSFSEHQEVNFRIKIGNYPIISTEAYPNQYLCLINLAWKDNELQKLNRTLLNLNPIDQRESVTLESGQEVLQMLKTKASIMPKDIDDLRIGYRMKTVSDSNSSINLVPEWFYKQKGKWHSIYDAAQPKKPLEGESSAS